MNQKKIQQIQKDYWLAKNKNRIDWAVAIAGAVVAMPVLSLFWIFIGVAN